MFTKIKSALSTAWSKTVAFVTSPKTWFGAVLAVASAITAIFTLSSTSSEEEPESDADAPAAVSTETVSAPVDSSPETLAEVTA